MSRFKLLYFVTFIINFNRINAQISDKRLCVDEECKVPISMAKTLLKYSSPDSRILSFAPNIEVTIYSKSAGSRVDLWGAEINGKRGYIPKHLIRETKIIRKPTILVNTEFTNETEPVQVPSPDKVQEAFEVVDGTTIYLNPQDAINPSSTESPIQSTALPETAIPNEQPPKENPKTETDLDKSDDTEVIEELEAVEDEQSSDVIVETIESENAVEEPEPTKTETDPQETAAKSEIGVDVKAEAAKLDSEDVKLEATESLESAPQETIIESIPATAETITEDKSKAEAVNLEAIDSLESAPQETVTESILATVKTSAEQVEKENEETEVLEPHQDFLNDSSSEETSSEENLKANASEEVTSSKENLKANASEEEKREEIEVTTLTPEIEVPQPFEDNTEEVTLSPIISPQESESKENPIPSLPPLSLFGSPSLSEASSENIQTQNQQNQEEIAGSEEVQIDGDIKLPEMELNLEKSEESNDISFIEKNIENTEESVEDKTEENAGLFSGFMSMFELGSEEIIEKSVITDNKEAENKEETGKYAEDKEQSGTVVEEVNEETGKDSEGNVIEDKVEAVEGKEEKIEELTFGHVANPEDHVTGEDTLSRDSTEQYCDATTCQKTEEPTESFNFFAIMDLFSFNSDVFLYLVTTAVSVIIFLFGYIALDKSKREGPLIARINNLEKELLIVVKENQILQGKVSGESDYDTNDRVSSEVVDNLKQDLYEVTSIKNALEEQVQSLEKELENSTEVGMELNRMLSEILSSESGSDVLKANVEHLQRQLVEQQSTINSVNETLAITNTENHELKLELELSNKKVIDLQAELDKLLLNVLKIEEEKETQQTSLESEMNAYKQKYEETADRLRLKEEESSAEIKQLKTRAEQAERNLQLKIKEHDVLVDSFKQLKALKTNGGPTLQSLLDVSGVKAELLLLKTENQRFSEKLQLEEEAKAVYEKKAQAAVEEAQRLREKYDEADKLKVETETKLEVLSNYFKDREAQLQKEIAKHESLWVEKQGEATSTTERIKFMQEQLQNYKSQTESLKQEIISQEVELKSQISVLEKKAHENWVSARQAERKLEEAKQEAAQLRHRLTLRERAIHDDKNQHRYQSPVEQNGDLPVSHLESPASPPLLYGTRDHITKSPPIPGLPPFLPPPPGVPFMPPPLPGVPPFIPPPPNMFPGDHRPPPLGRMSSPPLNSRYSPSSRGYSPYDSSPSDSEYGTSPPQRRGYSPFNSRVEDRRDYKRPPPGRSNGRNIMKDGGSSGSGHSHESLDKINRQQSKV